MKKDIFHFILLMILLFLFTRINAQEQPSSSAEDRAAKLTQWMKTNLKLIGDQGTRAYQINLKYAHEMDELKKSSLGTMEKMKVFKAHDKARDEELKAVFTADQYKRYQEKEASLKKQFRGELKTSRGG